MRRALPWVATTASPVAVLFAASLALGAIRDVALVRRFGASGTADSLFTVTTFVYAQFGVLWSAILLPFLASAVRTALRWTVGMTAIAALLAGGLTVFHVVSLPVGLAMIATAPLQSWLTVRAARHILAGGGPARINLLGVLSNLLVLIVIASSDSGEVVAVAQACSVSAALGLLYRGHGGKQSAPARADYVGRRTPLVVAGIAYQYFPVAERALTLTMTAGTTTVVAIASKVASLPSGVFGAALGYTALHRAIARGGLALPHLLRGKARAVLLGVAAAAVVTAAITWYGLPVLGEQLLQLSAADMTSLRRVTPIYVAAAVVQSATNILHQDAVGRGDLVAVSRGMLTFVLAYVMTGTVSLATRSAMWYATCLLATHAGHGVAIWISQSGLPRRR